MDPAIGLLRELVAIDSTNPSLVPGGRGEVDVAQRIAAELSAAGLEVEVSEVAPGRPNVVAWLRGRAPGPTLMFCGHSDTVGVGGMERPFSADVREGRLYGRGSQDMKGGLAAMVSAARRLAETGGLDRGSLVVAAVVDEEHASRGAEALVSAWRADAAVVPEPTGLDVGVAHKGFQWVAIETRGRAAHGSRPREGRDAIFLMGRVLARLEALDARLQRATPHPLLGTASLHASIIEGGREWSSYPDRAVLQMERRTLPGEAPDAAQREVEAIVAVLGAEDPAFEASVTHVFGREAYAIAADHPLPDLMARAAASTGCVSARVGMSFWTDAAILGAAGIPTVLFGPGGGGLHGPDEYVMLEDVCRCRDALVVLARLFTAHGVPR